MQGKVGSQIVKRPPILCLPYSQMPLVVIWPRKVLNKQCLGGASQQALSEIWVVQNNNVLHRNLSLPCKLRLLLMSTFLLFSICHMCAHTSDCTNLMGCQSHNWHLTDHLSSFCNWKVLNRIQACVFTISSWQPSFLPSSFYILMIGIFSTITHSATKTGHL